MARDAGAKKVYFASAAPEIRHPNVYGIDMPVASELVAHNSTLEDICKSLGADWLIYQDLQVLIDAAKEGNANIPAFETSVFTGNYITEGIDDAYFKELAKKRSDSARQEQLT